MVNSCAVSDICCQKMMTCWIWPFHAIPVCVIFLFFSPLMWSWTPHSCRYVYASMRWHTKLGFLCWNAKLGFISTSCWFAGSHKVRISCARPHAWGLHMIKIDNIWTCWHCCKMIYAKHVFSSLWVLYVLRVHIWNLVDSTNKPKILYMYFLVTPFHFSRMLLVDLPYPVSCWHWWAKWEIQRTSYFFICLLCNPMPYI